MNKRWTTIFALLVASATGAVCAQEIKGNAKAAGASGADINGYIGQVKNAIESKFYDASSFAGKTCDLRIKLAPDGLLISVQAAGGDPALCQAAVSAAKLAHIPKPPSDAVYQHVKNATLEFKP